MTKYFYLEEDEKFGPFIKAELINENLNRDTKIWFYGLEEWTKISDIKELKDIFNSIPPELITKNQQVQQAIFVNQKTEPTISKKKIPKDKINKNIKMIISGLVILIIALLLYKSFENHKDNNLYKKISSSSYETDVNFQMYVDKFYRDVGVYGIFPKKPKTTIIRFAKLDQLHNTTHIHGLSYGSDNDDKIEIYINPSTWKNFNKPMRYFLMYHELAHDILNLDDLEETSINEEKLMYPAIADYEKKDMDDFIESSHALFEQIAEKQN